jgi:glutamate formiminotransferase
MMIALNVSLARGGIDAAKHIARMVRANPKERKGQNVPSHLLEHTGLHNVQAIGWEMSKLGVYQVSMNLLEPDKSGIYEVYCAVAQWAKYLGCGVAGAEMIGLALEKYFIEAGRLFAKDLGLELQAGKELIELAYHELRFGHLMSEITSDRTIEGLLSIGEIQWSWK